MGYNRKVSKSKDLGIVLSSTLHSAYTISIVKSEINEIMRASLIVQLVKNLPAMQETPV